MDAHFLGEEQCNQVKNVVSKYGITVVCDEKEEEKRNADIVLPASEQCENMKTVASKVGVTVVCDEEN